MDPSDGSTNSPGSGCNAVDPSCYDVDAASFSDICEAYISGPEITPGPIDWMKDMEPGEHPRRSGK